MCQKETYCAVRENTIRLMMGEIVLQPLNVDSIVPADNDNWEICRLRACCCESRRTSAPDQK